ncbi:hypothetical protein KEM56_002469 [Ascosphaera pollenicola]|nr:hypothetical protein KEM56_002469 [Ascosphaera pollenicola]
MVPTPSQSDHSTTQDHKKRLQRIRPGTFITATTGLVGLARDVLPEGIRKGKFNPKAPLTIMDLAFAPGVIQDDIEKQIRTHLLFEAIRYIHPKSVESIFTKAHLEMPQFPVVKRLQPSKTEFHEMGPINANEETKSGCITVMDTIFECFGIPQDDPVFQEMIQLLYSDQKTVSLVQSVKKDCRTSKTPFVTFLYMLPIPGLFHFRMNFMDLVYSLFVGEKGSEKSAASITENIRFMGIACGSTMPFHHKQEAVIRILNARILAMFYDRIKSSCDLREYATIE